MNGSRRVNAPARCGQEGHVSVTSSPDATGPPDVAEFHRLFDAYYVPIRGYLARRIGAHAAEDLAAETFLTAYRERQRFDPAVGGPRPWLFGIATNLLRHHLRTELRGYRATADARIRTEPEDAHDVQVARRVDAERSVRALADVLARLDPRDRDVLLLSSWAGLSNTEIAMVLGVPAGTVGSRLHRVRQFVRAQAPRVSREDGHG